MTAGDGYYCLPENFTPARLQASAVVPGDIIVFGFTVYSTKAAAQFLNVFDAAVLPADGATPAWSWPLAANNGVGFAWQPNGRRFQDGLALCNSSTDATKTIGSADCFFDVQYLAYADH